MTTASKEVAVVVAEKPMNQTQMKNLQHLVDIDFRELREKVISDIQMRKSKRIDAIEAKFGDADAGLTRMQDKLRKYVASCAEKAAVLSAEMRERGFGFTSGGTAVGVPSDQSFGIVRVGKNEELNRVQRAAERLTNVATQTIGQEKRKIDRVILLQGITGSGAQQIIDDMPEVGDIFKLVQEALKDHEDDVVVLFGEGD